MDHACSALQGDKVLNGVCVVCFYVWLCMLTPDYYYYCYMHVPVSSLS